MLSGLNLDEAKVASESLDKLSLRDAHLNSIRLDQD